MALWHSRSASTSTCCSTRRTRRSGPCPASPCGRVRPCCTPSGCVPTEATAPAVQPRGREASEIQAGLAVLDTSGRDGVDVALAEQDVVLAVQLDLATVLRIEEDAVAQLDLAHVGTGR